MNMAEMAMVRLPLLELEGDDGRYALGALSVKTPAGLAALPLARVDMSARAAERVAQVTVTQVFRNPYADHLEAVYIFPLPGGSAVSHFEMAVKDRVIVGKVEERGEARRQYCQALDEGRRAALLEKERDDVFTVQVGNIPPGEDVTVRITYSERLPFLENGSTELRLPLVVAPRYIPGEPLDRGQVGMGVEVDTDAAPDASRITPPRLAPGLDPKVALSLRVELLPSISDGTPASGETAASGGTFTLGELVCSQHAVKSVSGDGVVLVELARDCERLNRDFILRWRIAGESLATSLLTYRDEDGAAYAMLSLVPPRRDGFTGLARDVVFVLDRSGSMGGSKMTSAARACAILLATLEPRDRFAVQAFDDQIEWMERDGGLRFVRADEGGLDGGRRFLAGIASRGGTELDAAMADALEAIRAREDCERSPVIVLVTDGQVGDESQVLRRIQREIGDARVFTVGIDTAVNEAFLVRLAHLGGGTSSFVTPGENLEEALRAVGREIGEPLAVDLSLKEAGGTVAPGSLAPERLPDLFAGRASTAYLRFEAIGALEIQGTLAGGKTFRQAVMPREVALPALAHLWARAHVAELEDRFRLDLGDRETIRREIVEVAKRHTLLTKFTAFVVVDESEVVNVDGAARTVVQPVEMPDMWEMEAPLMRSAAAPLGPPAPMAMLAGGFSGLDSCGGGVMMSLAAPGPTKAKARASHASLLRGRRTKGEVRDEERRYSPRRSPALEKALDELDRLLRAALDELKAGRVPAHAALNKARRALLDAAAHDLEDAHRFPKLQRFMRAGAMELVAALKAKGAAPASLVPLFEKRLKELAEAVKEVAEGSPGGSFWESTV